MFSPPHALYRLSGTVIGQEDLDPVPVSQSRSRRDTVFLRRSLVEVSNMPHRSPSRTDLESRSVAHERTRREVRRLLRKFRCRVAACLVGGLVMTATPIPVSAQSLDRWVADVLEGIRERMDEDGSILSHGPLTGTLDAGESASVPVHTCSGIQYTAQGVCDFGCTDFDLTAYDASGDVLDSDVLSDDLPILVFTPAESGITTLSVEMVSCTGSCDWGAQLFIDDPAPPVAPASADGGASFDWDPYVGTYGGPGGDTTILRHENRLVVLFPLSPQQDIATGVLRPTGSLHAFVLERDGPSADGEYVRFVVNGAGEVTAVFVAGHESRRVE